VFVRHLEDVPCGIELADNEFLRTETRREDRKRVSDVPHSRTPASPRRKYVGQQNSTNRLQVFDDDVITY